MALKSNASLLPMLLLEYKLHSRDDDVVYIWTTDDDVSCHGILAFEHYNLWFVLEIPEQ